MCANVFALKTFYERFGDRVDMHLGTAVLTREEHDRIVTEALVWAYEQVVTAENPGAALQKIVNQIKRINLS